MKRPRSFSRAVHLSHVIDERIPLWPGDPCVSLRRVADWDTDGYGLHQLCIGEHSGTHLNSPRTFSPSAPGTDLVEPGSLVAQAAVIDVSSRAAVDPDVSLAIQDVLDWEESHGRLPEGYVVLLHSGWQDRWHTPKEFLGIDAEGRPHYPGFGMEVARWLFDERGIVGLGIDTHGLEPGIDTGFRVNRLVLERRGLALENLANLAELPAVGATLVIGVLRLKDGTGSPAAVIALLP